MKGGNVYELFSSSERPTTRNMRMLFAEKLQPAIQTVLNDKGKIEFHISIAADQEVFEEGGRTLQDFDFVSYSISKVKGLKHGLFTFPYFAV